MRRTYGFTLIELLIVVAIIAILAAIAVPNFLEAQVRAKVSRVKNDFRTIALGLEAYRTDNNDYIPHYVYPYEMARAEMNRLSTPIAYMTSIPSDPFSIYDQTMWTGNRYRYERVEKLATVSINAFPENGWMGTLGGDWALAQYNQGKVWMLWSIGPDRVHTFYIDALQYDPTNGSMSRGDIIRLGP